MKENTPLKLNVGNEGCVHCLQREVISKSCPGLRRPVLRYLLHIT